MTQQEFISAIKNLYRDHSICDTDSGCNAVDELGKLIAKFEEKEEKKT